MQRSRKGGIVSGLLVIIAVLAVAFLVTGIRFEHNTRYGRAQTQIETPLGSVRVDARDNFDPGSVGVPVYPGAIRQEGDGGGALLDFDWDGKNHQAVSLVAAKYTTEDSPEKVRDFYQSRLPHGIIMHRRGSSCFTFKFSREGYKRIIAVDEHDGRTRIAIASLGGAGAN